MAGMGNSCAGGPVNGPAAAAAAATTGEPALEPARAEHAPAACPAARAKAAQRGDAAAAAVGEPLYRPTMWLATARPVGKLNAFLGDTAPPRGHPALAVLAYQPDCRAFCAKVRVAPSCPRGSWHRTAVLAAGSCGTHVALRLL